MAPQSYCKLNEEFALQNFAVTRVGGKPIFASLHEYGFF